MSPDLGDLGIELVSNINFFGSDIAIRQNPLFVQSLTLTQPNVEPTK